MQEQAESSSMAAITSPSSSQRYSRSPLQVNVEKGTQMKNYDKTSQRSIIQKSAMSLLERVENEHKNKTRVPSIYMAPDTLRDLSPSSFNPRVVSSGPLHREDENVQAFEGHKISHLVNLMSRLNSTKWEILESCMQKVYDSMEQIRACYVWTKTYGDHEIAEMMVMDACFILEFVNQISVYNNKSYRGNMLPEQTIIYDLVLLENQLPFFILNEIFQCTILNYDPQVKSLIEFIRPLLNLLNLFKTDIEIHNIPIDTTHHILSLLHTCYIPRVFTPSDILSSTIHSAINLDRAGVNFKPNKDPTWLMGMDVTSYELPCFFGFWSKPTLKMPVLDVHHFTELVLRNLIAYEQSFESNNYITSYAIAMDRLVNTQEDVAKLIDSKVLVNYMGSNEEAANMINSICKEIAGVDFFYQKQWTTLNRYCDGYWPKNIARMRSTYFSSPWNMIALLAGIILFALTVVQTIFTIKSAQNKM